MTTFRTPQQITTDGGLVLPKTQNVGIKIDETTPTFGWDDILGEVRPKTSGAGTPTLATYRGGQIQLYSFVANDIIDFDFHMPHDLVVGSDIFFHLHWSHNGTNISGNFVATYYAIYAKGHNQANFPAEVSSTITYNTVDLATTPQYRHRIDEIQLSAGTPGAGQLDSDDLEPDGLIHVRCIVTTLPTVTAGNLFIHFGDLHYQSTGMTTKQKAPPFWT